MKRQHIKMRVCKNAFNAIQELIKDSKILAGHDVASGGLITTLLELVFC